MKTLMTLALTGALITTGAFAPPASAAPSHPSAQAILSGIAPSAAARQDPSPQDREYAQREASAPELEGFVGGNLGLVGVVLLVLLILLLI